jgi:hypothetical protein
MPDRSERIAALVKVALSILRRTDRYNLTLADGSRYRGWDFRHNDLSLTFRRRIDADDRPATLIVKYDGDRVLIAQWTTDSFTRRAYKPGNWENVLRRCDRMPTSAGHRSDVI